MKTNQKIAIEVLMGQWGDGQDRRNRLATAGYDPDAIQTIVNSLISDGAFPGQEEIEIKGNKTKNVTINLSEYNSLSITLEV